MASPLRGVQRSRGEPGHPRLRLAAPTVPRAAARHPGRGRGSPSGCAGAATCALTQPVVRGFQRPSTRILCGCVDVAVDRGPNSRALTARRQSVQRRVEERRGERLPRGNGRLLPVELQGAQVLLSRHRGQAAGFVAGGVLDHRSTWLCRYAGISVLRLALPDRSQQREPEHAESSHPSVHRRRPRAPDRRDAIRHPRCTGHCFFTISMRGSASRETLPSSSLMPFAAGEGLMVLMMASRRRCARSRSPSSS